MGLVALSESQSPDGDFFDPELYATAIGLAYVLCHSPLTGIFLIRRPSLQS